MNSFLAEMYGTRETIGAPQQSDDVEKLAEAQLLDEALRAENIDVDSLSPDAILKVASTLFGDDSALVKAAAEEAGEHVAEGEAAAEGEHTGEGEAAAEGEHTAEGEGSEEKVAEADFLGRVMAHSFTQERAEIDKQAGIKDIAGKAWEHTKGAPGKAFGALKGKGHAMAESFKKGKGEGHGFKATLHGAAAAAKEHKKTVGGVAAGTAAAAAAPFALHKKKHGSALDKLAEERAVEILRENGIGQAEDEKLASAVEQRAWEMLAEQGYTQAE
jgi:hypothetical protein